MQTIEVLNELIYFKCLSVCVYICYCFFFYVRLFIPTVSRYTL